MLILCVIDTREFGLKIYFWRMYASLVGQSPFKVGDLPIIWPKASAQLSQARGHSDLTLKTYSFSRVKRWQMQEEIKNDVSLFKVSRPCEKPWSGLLFWAGLAMLKRKKRDQSAKFSLSQNDANTQQMAGRYNYVHVLYATLTFYISSV